MRIVFSRGWLLLMVLLPACGTFATPVWQTTPSTAVIVDVSNIQPELQSTTISSATPMPPISITEPTSTATNEPSPTIEPTVQSESPIDRLVAISDPVNGKTLFNLQQPTIGFACATCHRHDSEDRLIGPGLLNIGQRAETRIEGQSSAEYVYNSIKNPNDYVVESFTADLMPKNWGDVYSDNDILDIVAYLMTLEADPVSESVTENVDVTPTDTEFIEGNVVVSIPDTANAANGAELFQTFQPDAGFACSTCHQSDSEDRLIGPGLLNIGQRANTRVDGQSAIDYMYTSITNPGAFVVPDFPDGLMPANWAEIYSEDQIYDIIAYLLTLESS